MGNKEDIKPIQKHKKEEIFPKKKNKKIQFMGELMLRFEVKVERIWLICLKGKKNLALLMGLVWSWKVRKYGRLKEWRGNGEWNSDAKKNAVTIKESGGGWSE